jgi:hypothetical protein
MRKNFPRPARAWSFVCLLTQASAALHPATPVLGYSSMLPPIAMKIIEYM